MRDFLIISDVHGCFSLLEAAVQDWNPITHKLIFVGDYVDRGYHSLEVVQLLHSLKEKYPEDIEIMMGNHDDMFLEYVQNPNCQTSGIFINHGGPQTLASFFGSDFLFLDNNQAKERVIDKIELLRFMVDFKLYHEEEHIIFVHAGFIMPKDGQHFSERNTFDRYLWMENFFKQSNTTGKTIVFGHTPVKWLNPPNTPVQPYLNQQNRYIGVDGGASLDGALLAVEVSYDGVMKGYKKYK